MNPDRIARYVPTIVRSILSSRHAHGSRNAESAVQSAARGRAASAEHAGCRQPFLSHRRAFSSQSSRSSSSLFTCRATARTLSAKLRIRLKAHESCEIAKALVASLSISRAMVPRSRDAAIAKSPEPGQVISYFGPPDPAAIASGDRPGIRGNGVGECP